MRESTDHGSLGCSGTINGPLTRAGSRRRVRLCLAMGVALVRIYSTGAIGEIYGRWFGTFGKSSDLLLAMYYLNSTPE